MANTVRSRDRFGPVSPEELAALPGTEKEMWVEVADGRKVHVFEERPEHLPAKVTLLLNFHGGGFIKGRTDRDRRYCCTLMEQLNCLVWDVDYCLAPEQAFPAAVEETYGIIAYAFDHAEELGIDHSKNRAGWSQRRRKSCRCRTYQRCGSASPEALLRIALNIFLWTTRSIL